MRGAYSTIRVAIFCLTSVYSQVGVADGKDFNPSQRFHTRLRTSPLTGGNM